jgi:catechol 2,3-dioxygenase-like lactoylglutathione lyase family enzyme
MITELSLVGVPVTDQDRALDFYVGTLGLEKRRDATFGGGMRWVEVVPSGGGAAVALVPPGMGRSAGVDTGIRFVTPDADAAHADLAAKGVDVDEVLRWEGVPTMFSLRDPDGNWLYMVEPGD